MKTSTLIVVLVAAVVVAGAAFLLTRGESPVAFAIKRDVPLIAEPVEATVSVVFAADRVNAPNTTSVETRGFLEGVEYHTTSGTLRLVGWSPVEMQNASGRLFVRDPFGAAVPSGRVQLTPVDRPDVRRALGATSPTSSYGFDLSIPLQEAGSGSAWLRSLEIYANDGGTTLYVLNAASSRPFRTWVKSPDAFELAVVFATPAYAEGAPDSGHVDLVEPDQDAGTVRIHGWAPFDARSPDSFLCLRLPRSMAPASIVARQSRLRPDVPPIVDPSRPELEFGGFVFTLTVSGPLDDLRETGAFALWSIENGEAPVSIHIGNFD